MRPSLASLYTDNPVSGAYNRTNLSAMRSKISSSGSGSVCVCNKKYVKSGQSMNGLRGVRQSKVAEVGVFQVGKVPTNMYEYPIP